MIIKKPDFALAKESYKEYEYALIYMMSDIIFSRTIDIENVNWDECLEARFFDSEKELHMLCGNECFARVVQDTDEDVFIERKYKLETKYSRIGGKLIAKQFINSDKDGQSYISLTRLCGVE